MNRLTKYTPHPLWKEIERFWEEPWRGFERLPLVDVEELDDHIKVIAELPGFDKGEIEIQLEGNVLTIRGEKTEEKGRKFLRRERAKSVTRFERRFYLPMDIAADQATAKFEKGELIVTIPKADANKARNIPIT